MTIAAVGFVLGLLCAFMFSFAAFSLLGVFAVGGVALLLFVAEAGIGAGVGALVTAIALQIGYAVGAWVRALGRPWLSTIAGDGGKASQKNCPEK